MGRRALFIVVGVLLVVAGWSAGRTTAQSRVADFEISIDAPGQVNITCARGCDWPSSGVATPLPTMNFRCESERCRWMLNGYGRITLGFPR